MQCLHLSSLRFLVTHHTLCFVLLGTDFRESLSIRLNFLICQRACITGPSKNTTDRIHMLYHAAGS